MGFSLQPKQVWQRTLVVTVLFTFGAVVHLTLFRAYARWRPARTTDRSIVDHPAANLAFALIGGIAVAWVMLRLVSQIRHLCVAHALQRALLRGGLLGILATAATIYAFSVLLTVAVNVGFPAEYIWRAVRELPALLMALAVLSLPVIIASIPFDFVYGAICAGFILYLQRHHLT